MDTFFSLNEMHFKMSFTKWQPFGSSLHVLISFVWVGNSSKNCLQLPHATKINSLAPGRCGCNLKSVTFQVISRIGVSWALPMKLPQVKCHKLHWWLVNIGSGNGLVPLGIKPLPELMLTQISITRPQWVKCCLNQIRTTQLIMNRSCSLLNINEVRQQVGQI